MEISKIKVITGQIIRKKLVVTIFIRQNEISSEYLHSKLLLCESSHFVSLTFEIVFLAYINQSVHRYFHQYDCSVSFAMYEYQMHKCNEATYLLADLTIVINMDLIMICSDGDNLFVDH